MYSCHLVGKAIFREISLSFKSHFYKKRKMCHYKTWYGKPMRVLKNIQETIECIFERWINISTQRVIKETKMMEEKIARGTSMETSRKQKQVTNENRKWIKIRERE